MTKTRPNSEREPDEFIDVTPEMIEAGYDELLPYNGEANTEKEMKEAVVAVYMAMVAVFPKDRHGVSRSFPFGPLSSR